MEDTQTDVLRAVFDKYDKKGKGYLTHKQFVLLIDRLSKYIPELRGTQLKEAETAFVLFDKNSDRKLDFSEFSDWWNTTNRFSFFFGKKAKLLRKAYTLYAKYTQSSEMSLSEFMTMMEELGIPASLSDFNMLDESGNGTLNFFEFCKWLNWF